MIGGAERLLEVRRTVLADLQKTIGKAEALFLADALEPLTKGNRDGGRHAIPSQLCQLLRQAVRFLIFDVEVHLLPFYYIIGSILPSSERDARGGLRILPH